MPEDGPLWPQHITCVDEIIKFVVFDGILLSFLNCVRFVRSYLVGSWTKSAVVIVMNGQGVVLNKNYKTEVKQYFVYSELNPKVINN